MSRVALLLSARAGKLLEWAKSPIGPGLQAVDLWIRC
jgi:hypothetical protein